MSKNADFEYFGLNGRAQLRPGTKSLAEYNKVSIIRVAEFLAVGKVLTHNYVVDLMKLPEEKLAEATSSTRTAMNVAKSSATAVETSTSK